MSKRRSATYFLLVLLTLTIFFYTATSTEASIQDLFDKAKGLLAPAANTSKEIKLSTNVSLVPEGDQNQNGEIDSGDTIRFTFQLENPSSETIKFTNLKTNIDRQLINYIRNEYGITSFNDDGKSLEIPYIILYPNQNLEIRFDADINYFSKEDKVISTEAELFDKDQKSISKSQKKEVSAKKLDKEIMQKHSNIKEANTKETKQLEKETEQSDK